MSKKEQNLITRPPVVVILGHVDHGKSSLLEAIKDLKITEHESGGITQHMGAYAVSHEEKSITFIDTPGHEAFSAMRSRGTEVADIGILVVAADESVKEQTKEAISHLKESGMPFLVAINKMDKQSAEPEKIKQDLSKEGIFLESYGGKIPSVNISAIKKSGINDLLEMVLLLAEMEGMKGNPNLPAEGVVIETHLDSQRGAIVTLLVKSGTLKKGDIIATRSSFGKLRVMEGFLGEELEEAGISTPVQVVGLKGSPRTGDEFFVCSSVGEAKKIASQGVERKSFVDKEEKSNLNVIIKADVVGLVEAIESSLEKIPQEEIGIRIVSSGIGSVNETDIELAKATGSKIFAFRVKKDRSAEKMSIKEGVEVKEFNVIYELIEEVKKEAEELLEPEVVRNEQGQAKVLAVFREQKDRQVLGGEIIKGEARKGFLVEVWREKEKVAEGKIIGLKKEEKDIEKISGKEEFGMLFEGNGKAKEKDILLFYTEETVKRTL